MGNFRELKVWQKARELAVSVYKFSSAGDLAKDFSFRDQIRRSAVSIVSNIAEGDDSGGDKVSVRYFNIAKGSSAELYTQLLILKDLEISDSDKLNDLISECDAISRMLHRLIEARK
jgi:four helix bundle protein